MPNASLKELPKILLRAASSPFRVSLRSLWNQESSRSDCCKITALYCDNHVSTGYLLNMGISFAGFAAATVVRCKSNDSPQAHKSHRSWGRGQFTQMPVLLELAEQFASLPVARGSVVGGVP